MEYLRHWGLHDKPFLNAYSSFFFAAATQRESIAGLSYFAGSRFSTAFLVAEPGCGSTYLLNHISRLNGMGDCATEVVVTRQTRGDCAAVADGLADALGIRQTIADVGAIGLDLAIEACDREGVRLIWCIDELDPCSFGTARNLLASHKNLRVVFSATPESCSKYEHACRHPSMRIDLDAIGLDDVVEYVEKGIEFAGGTRQLFDDNAKVRISELSEGRIAQVAHLAESALCLAAQYNMSCVSSSVIEGTLDQVARAA